MEEIKRNFVERRRGPDIVLKTVWWIVGISWVLSAAVFLITGQARPQNETFFDRFFDVTVRDYWDENLLAYAFVILLMNFIVCVVGFILNLLRQKRKADKISKSIIILGTISLAGIIWYLVR